VASTHKASGNVLDGMGNHPQPVRPSAAPLALPPRQTHSTVEPLPAASAPSPPVGAEQYPGHGHRGVERGTSGNVHNVQHGSRQAVAVARGAGADPRSLRGSSVRQPFVDRPVNTSPVASQPLAVGSVPAEQSAGTTAYPPTDPTTYLYPAGDFAHLRQVFRGQQERSAKAAHNAALERARRAAAPPIGRWESGANTYAPATRPMERGSDR
jgi:hypothetical protein